MRRDSVRPLVILLLLTLAAPAPRMAAWLLGAAPSCAFVSTRHEPPARGSNRIAAPVDAARVAARAGLASGTARSADRPNSAVRPLAGATTPARGPSSSPPSSEPAAGSFPLRC